jgi:predicted nucleic-acid-binding Zn-ribbon protein
MRDIEWCPNMLTCIKCGNKEIIEGYANTTRDFTCKKCGSEFEYHHEPRALARLDGGK